MNTELKARGFAIFQAAMNENPQVAEFVKYFGLNYPVGTIDATKAREFMQISLMQQTAYYPWFALVDRKGQIREQHFGDGFVLKTNEQGPMRTLLTKYLNEAAAGAASPRKK